MLASKEKTKGGRDAYHLRWGRVLANDDMVLVNVSPSLSFEAEGGGFVLKKQRRSRLLEEESSLNKLQGALEVENVQGFVRAG